jgi:hypothetical protein
MISSIREQYNKDFTEETYKAYLHDLENVYPGQLDFRVAETPLFISKNLRKKCWMHAKLF